MIGLFSSEIRETVLQKRLAERSLCVPTISERTCFCFSGASALFSTFCTAMI